VQAVKGPLSAAGVAQLMRISPERAELLLAHASVASLLNEVPAARLRVEAPSLSAGPTEREAPETVLSQSEPRGKTMHGDTEI
jgi:hypothetical protein